MPQTQGSVGGFSGGWSNLGTLAKQLPKLGVGIAGMANSMSDVDEDDVANATNAAKIVKAFAQGMP
jgi:hypothetical protein